MFDIQIRVDPRPDAAAFAQFWEAAWGAVSTGDLDAVWSRSLAHLCAHADERLVAYVNVAWDGGIHAFILDTSVHPDYRHRGLGTLLVQRAVTVARERGAHWLHVDYEPHLAGFYRACGFRRTEAGLIDLKA